MERMRDVFDRLSEWGAARPEVPLPAPPDLALAIVAATILAGVGLTGLIAAWADRRLSILALLLFAVGLAMFYWLLDAGRGGFGLVAITDAFVEILARLIR